MVLLLAYSNFQDRLLLCLGAPIETGGPMSPVDVTFAADAFVVKTTPTPISLFLEPRHLRARPNWSFRQQ